MRKQEEQCIKATMSMKLVFLTLCATILYHGTYGVLQGTFTWGAHSCKWTELRSPGPGPRTMVVNCKNLPVNCQFKGNPHSCAWYNNGHQKQFYQKLADQLGADANRNPCTYATVSYDRKCPGVDFTRQNAAALWAILNRALILDDVTDTDELFYDGY